MPVERLATAPWTPATLLESDTVDCPTDAERALSVWPVDVDSDDTAAALLVDRLLTAVALPATPVDSELTDASVDVESAAIWFAVPVDRLAIAT